MRDLCNTDKPLFAVLTKLTYSAYLNILWLENVFAPHSAQH